MTLTLGGLSNSISSVFLSDFGLIAFFLVVFFLTRDLWLRKKTLEHVRSRQWVLLEVRIPRNNLKSILSMEHVFASLYAIYGSSWKRFTKRYFEGKVMPWFSFELVGDRGGVHFYIRAQVDHQNLVEVALFSQYPDVEINEVEDYVSAVRPEMIDADYDVSGTDYLLARDSFYHIKTYRSFESTKDEFITDPISVITETMSRLKDEERMWLQLVIKPADDTWKKKGEEEIDKISGRGKPAKPVFGASVGEFMKNLIQAPVVHPTWGSETKENNEKIRFPSHYENEIIKVVGEKISRLGFDTIVRFVYLDKKETFEKSSRPHTTAVNGAFRLLSSQTLNGLKPNDWTMIDPDHIRRLFRKSGLLDRKRKLLTAYRERTPVLPMAQSLKFKDSVLNTEELATLYHPPAFVVSAPKLNPLEAKKGTPPANLPLG